MTETFTYKNCNAHSATQHTTDWIPRAVSGPDGRIPWPTWSTAGQSI